MIEYISQFVDANPIVMSLYGVIKWTIIVADVIFLGVTIYSIKKLLHYRPTFVWDPRKWQKHVKTKKKVVPKSPLVVSAWKKVQERVKDGSPESLRLAVIEADGAVDEALKRMGLGGETFADRLSAVSPQRYPTVEAVWDAHRLRNNLVHTPDFQLGPTKAENAVHAYENFLKEIKAL